MPKKQKKLSKKQKGGKKEILIRSPKGVFDILPSDQKYYERIIDMVKEFAFLYGFEKIDTPIIEYTDLFTRSLGEKTDIVEKEMYSFKTKGGDKVVLRPEGTAPIARAYFQHGLFNLPSPHKFFYIGPMFRYENPQAGRFRQFYQFGFEILNEQDPIYDAQIMNLLKIILESLGIKNLIFQINSIGCKSCRKIYVKKLIRYYKKHLKNLCRYCKIRYNSNPLRLLDCKDEKCQPIKKQAPITIDYLCSDCKKHFKSVLEYLDELGLLYILSPHLVRGLDYYTNTVFEIVKEEPKGENSKELILKSQSALGGGGRFNNLLKIIGGKDMPAVGAACGFERIISEMKAANARLPKEKQPKVFLVQLGDIAKKKALKLFNDLQEEGIWVAESFGRDSIKSQLNIANRLNIPYALILGQKEALDETIILRDMRSGIQETIPMEKIISKLKQILKSL